MKILMVGHGHFLREILNLMLATQALSEFPHDNVGMTLMLRDAASSKIPYGNRPPFVG